MSFESYIPTLLQEFSASWNDAEMEQFSEIVAEEARLTTPGLVFTNVAIKPQVIEGKKDVMLFLNKVRKKLPLKTRIVDDVKVEGKKVSFKVHYYEIDVWSCFECLLTEYGKIKSLTITRLEDPEAAKISTIYVLKKIIKFRLKNIFSA